MKGTTAILLLVLGHTSVYSQYYFTGEVDGFRGDKLQHVAITVSSTGDVYRSGPDGDFAIISRQDDDTLTFDYDGYEKYTTEVRSSDFLKVTLQMQANAGRGNGVSYHLIRRFLEMGNPVPAGAVKIEELLSYFNTGYETPEGEECFHTSSTLLTCPWSTGRRLLMVNISGRKTDMERLPPGNLVLLIDVSGSMDLPDKLPLVKASLRPFINNLRPTDTVSIVQFGADLRVMAGVPGARKEVLIDAIEGLRANGLSPGGSGLRLAYAVARHQFIPGGHNRVLFVTDGDICGSVSEAEGLGQYIGGQAGEGIGLSCIAVGAEDSAARDLPYFAHVGGGLFTSVREEGEGEKAFLTELSAGTIAEDMSVTAQFDTTLGSGYRLIGFDHKSGVVTDTALRRGSVASGQSVMAVFEFTPKKDTSGVFAKIKIGYRAPGQSLARSISYDCSGKTVSWDRAALCQRRAVGVALFGMKLQGDDHAEASWAEVQKINKMVFADASNIDREYLLLIAKAKRIYEQKDDRSVSRGYNNNP